MKIEEIKNEWLLNVPTDYTDSELKMGFEAIGTFLGNNFLDERWKGQRGIAVVNQVVSLGLNLIAVNKIKGFEKMIKRLLNSSTHNIAISELACAITFAKSEVLIELYPPNPDKNGELEMKLRTNSKQDIFVEVVSPKTQVWNTFLIKLIEPIRKRTAQMQDMRLEVFIYKILDQEEQTELFKDCGQLVEKGKIDVELHKEGKYHIFLSDADTIRINSAERKTEEQTSLFVTNLNQTNGHKNLITVGVPFADQRAQQVLEGEYHQLTSSYPNIIIIDVSGVPKGIENWPTYIKRRLQPTLNRKISAVMLQSGINSKKIETKESWILNPHAHHKLNNDFLSTLEVSPNQHPKQT